MQVKIFVDDDIGLLETDVNEWLRTNDVTVRFVTQSEGSDGAAWGLTITIWYEND